MTETVMLDTAKTGTPEARVMAQIANRAAANGTPIYVLRRADGDFALGREIGRRMNVTTPFINFEAAVDLAAAVAGGHSQSMTHPKTLMKLATAILAVAISAQASAREAQIPGPLDEAAAPGQADIARLAAMGGREAAEASA